jgi:adenylate cyclase
VAAGGLAAAVGVSNGEVVAGNIGTEARYEYTVIGDPVNEAARLTELAKRRPVRLLASGAAVAAAGGEERACWQRDGAQLLRGRDAPTQLFVPVGAVGT